METDWKRIRRWCRNYYNGLDPYYHSSYRATQAINAAGEHFDVGHGAEGFCNQSNGQDGITYLNMGDPYITTILFSSNTERFSVGCWGNIVEAAPEGTYQ